MNNKTGKGKPRKLELLAPAANKEVAIQAILHGADAVYMGASSHGARKKAANSIEDIKEVVEFAHQFRARVYCTVNTLVYDNEIEEVEKLIGELYRIGVDALIVQDMGILRMKLPPIQLHASTQCDTRTVEKALFLQKVGFSQLVLARELSLNEIKEICDSVDVPVECFVHGALCVSYSGRCQASQVTFGRSANRGDCAQLCRMKYSLQNSDGEVLVKDKYLLSLKDFNTLERLDELVHAGVSSFKIEGRLKDAGYVKNVVAAYRRRLDEIIAAHPDKYVRSSVGVSSYTFIPKLDKSFNRGFTNYFLDRNSKEKRASLDTPKSQGEIISSVTELHNGDGISYYDNGEYKGVHVNRVEGNRIISARPFQLPKGAVIHRTFDNEWEKQMTAQTAVRKIGVDITLDVRSITATDQRGVQVTLPWEGSAEKSRKPMDYRGILGKLGNTIYELHEFKSNIRDDIFIRASRLTELRRALIDLLDEAARTSYPFEYRAKEDSEAPYISTQLISLDNVANRLAKEFYEQHGVSKIEPAIEVSGNTTSATPVMTTRYCILRELGACKKRDPKSALRKHLKEPLRLTTGSHSFRVAFDCARCEMNLYKD